MSKTTEKAEQKPSVKPKGQVRLTHKELLFLKEMAKGKNGTEAALVAYDTTSENTAAAIASENLRKPKLKDALEKAYAAAGINPQSIADVLADAMLAKKSVQTGGQLLETTLPDHSIRVNAARTAAQLIGAGKDDDGGKQPTINFNLGTQNYIKNAEVKP